MSRRHERQVSFFGEEGQRSLRSKRVAVVGAGGTGSHVVQQLAYLGVGGIVAVDSEELDETNLNRYVTAWHDDPIPGSRKVDLAERLIRRIDPEIAVTTVHDTLVSDAAYSAILKSDAVFGCVDKDGARFVLNELCIAYDLPYFDVASGITPEGSYGGRICVALGGGGCLFCYDELDGNEVDSDLSRPEQNEAKRAIYGVSLEELGNSGPSVVSINGVVASLGVTEFMVWATGIRRPHGLLTYRGNRGIVTYADPDGNLPWKGCYYCDGIRGQRDAADVQRYIREGVGEYLR